MGASCSLRRCTLQVFRGPTDNDGIKGWSGQEDKALGRWLAAGLDKIELETRGWKFGRGNVVVVHTVANTPSHREAIELKQIFSLQSGVLRVECEFGVHEDLPDLPRLGVALALVEGFEQLEWLANGPHENYCDRKVSARFGRWTSTVAEEYVPYVLPQEHGHKTGVQRLEVSNGEIKIAFSRAEQAV